MKSTRNQLRSASNGNLRISGKSKRKAKHQKKPARTKNKNRSDTLKRLVRQASLLAGENEAVIGYDTGFHVIFWNEAARSLYGFSAAEAVGKTADELLRAEYSIGSLDELKQEIGTSGRFETESIRVSKRKRRLHIDTRIAALRNRLGKIVGYIAIDRRIGKQKEREAQLVRVNRTLNAVRHTSEAAAKSKDEIDFLNNVCKSIVGDCGHAMVWVGYEEDNGYKSVRPVACSGFEEGCLETLKITRVDTGLGSGTTGIAVRTGKPALCRDLQTAPNSEPWRDQAIKRGCTSSISIPFSGGDDIMGTLTIYSRDHDPFTEDEVRLLTELADDVAYGIGVIRLREEQKDTEEKLRRSRENYRDLVESSGSIILRVDKNMRITFVNSYGLQFFGYSYKEIVGKRAVGSIVPERAENGYDTASMAEDIIRHPDRYATNVHQNMRKDGTLVWVSWANRPIFDSSGKVVEILSIGNDLSMQKEAEWALRKSESRFRLLSDIGDKLLASDNPRQIVNSLCAQVMTFLECRVFFNYLVGESADKLVLNAYAGIPDEEADKIKRIEFGVGMPGTVARAGKRIIAEDIQNTGDPRTEMVKRFGIQAYCCHPLKAQGEVIGTLSFGTLKCPRFKDDEVELMRTVADQVALAMQRVKSESELRRHREHLEELVAEQTAEIRKVNAYNRELLEASLDPLVTISSEGKLTDVNRAVEIVTGVPRDRLIGTSFSNYFTRPERAEEGYKKVLAEGEVRDYPLTIRHVSGKTTDVLYNATVYRNEEGNIQGVFAAARDVTEIRKAQEKQEVLITELARSNKELEQFAYVASHDLQEPLRMISSYTQLLARRYKDKLDSDAKEFVGFAVDGAVRMQALINSLLTYSRVGRKGTQFADVDCHAVVATAILNLKAVVDESGAIIVTDELPVVQGDEMQLVQLFQNLIGNSIKFRSEEIPKVRISAKQEGPQWVFSVTDNGIGIEPQYRDRVFVIFQRLHGREDYAGTGMGLAICKKIVERHGGKIWVESAPEKGAVLSFTIPKLKE